MSTLVIGFNETGIQTSGFPADLLVYSDFSSGILFYLFCRFVETGVTNEIADSRGG